MTHQGKAVSVCSFPSLVQGTKKAVNIGKAYFPKARLLCAFKHITLEYQECQTFPFLNFPV